MFRKLMDRGKCLLGLHDGQWIYQAAGDCAQTHVCARCDLRQTRVEHAWGAWSYDAAGACEQARTCERCGAAEARVAHLWPAWQLPAEGCTLGRACLRCGTAETGADQHSWGDWFYTEEGVCTLIRQCARCGQPDDDERTVHPWSDWSAADPPLRSCTRCGRTEARSPTVGAALLEVARETLAQVAHAGMTAAARAEDAQVPGLLAAREGRLVVFVGAGVSVVAPTCLPSWWAVNKAVVDALMSATVDVVGPVEAARLGRRIIDRQEAGQLPPEFLAEVVVGRLPDSYFEVLQCLDGDRPNRVHLGLAALARAGRLQAIVTTNFDRVTEAAFAELDVPLQVRARPGEFAALAAELDAEDALPCQLLKLHGSAEEPTTLIDTLAQRKVGLAPAKLDCLRRLLADRHWLLLGYSGADLEADPAYLGLRAAAADAAAFSWLVRPGTAPLPPVAELAALYGERGRIVEGELPACLEPLWAGVGVAPPEPEPVDVEVRRAAAAEAVRTHTRRWAAAQGVDWCGLVLADLLVAAGATGDALELLRALTASLAARDAAGREAAEVANTLGNVLQRSGELDEASACYGRALALFERAGHAGGCQSVLTNLAGVHRSRGEYDAADQLYTRAAALAGADRDWPLTFNRANVRLARGDVEGALRLAGEALAICERSGQERGRAQVLTTIALAQAERGATREADAAHRAVLAVARRLGDETLRAAATANLASLALAAGDLVAARTGYEQTLALCRAQGDAEGSEQALSNLGVLASREGRHEEALVHHMQAHELAEQHGDIEARARILLNLASVCQAQDQGDRARQLSRTAAELCEQIGDVPGQAKALHNLGLIAAARGDTLEALMRYGEALSLRQQTGDAAGAGRTCCALARAMAASGSVAEARQMAAQGLSHFERAAAADGVAEARALIESLGPD